MQIIVKDLAPRCASNRTFFTIALSPNQKKLGGIYKSLRCWYFDYNAANYKLISQTFTDLVIDNQNNETQPLAGLTISRDLPAIAKSELQLDAAPLSHNPEHITKPIC
jgi:hypothetical protein